MFISTYANKTTFILYAFILTLFNVWHGLCGGDKLCKLCRYLSVKETI